MLTALTTVFSSEVERWGADPLAAMEAEFKARRERMRLADLAAQRERLETETQHQRQRARDMLILRGPRIVFERPIKPSCTGFEPTVSPKAFMTPKIIRHVAKFFKISKHDLVGHRRTANILWPRFVAIYLVRKLTLRSLPEIGRWFNRDHTTIINALRRLDLRTRGDPAFGEVVDQLSRELAVA